jgi:hypothetical protein
LLALVLKIEEVFGLLNNELLLGAGEPFVVPACELPGVEG